MILRFWIPGICVPKARARVTRNGTYHPRRYQDWRQMAEAEILASLSPNVRALLPIQRAEVRITLRGKHRGDLDNLSGGVLDSLVAVNVLANDTLKHVPRLTIEHQTEGECGCWVEVKSS